MSANVQDEEARLQSLLNGDKTLAKMQELYASYMEEPMDEWRSAQDSTTVGCRNLAERQLELLREVYKNKIAELESELRARASNRKSVSGRSKMSREFMEVRHNRQCPCLNADCSRCRDTMQ